MTIPPLKYSALIVLINRSLRVAVEIYGEQRRLLIKELKLIERVRRNPRTGEEKKGDLRFKKKMYLRDFRQHLIITSFLMMYSYLEEALQLVGPAEGKGTTSNRKTGIEKSKDAFKSEMSLVLSDHPKWQDLKDFTKIRHFILHTNANMHLAKDSEEIAALLQRQSKFMFRFKGGVRLRESILPYFEGILDDFLRWILDEKQKAKRG